MILLITYILNIIDYLFTVHWVRLYGIEAEMNPLFRWMLEHNIAGFIKIFVAGGILALIGYIYKLYPKYAWTAYILLTLYAAVDVYYIILAVILARG